MKTKSFICLLCVLVFTTLISFPADALEGMQPDGRTYVEVFSNGDAVITDTVTGKKRYVTGYAPSEYERRVKEQAESRRAKKSGAVIHPDGSSSFYEVDKDGRGYVIHPNGNTSFIEPN